ncbi:Spt20 family-domain-containing protein [Kockovaella imperatae]|uniref:Spt20 family-domain-containing protein n=1 Tax=Kockovaella imperatae TaxID=4999 RepID=A0A1Y1UC00_9TREE|nr:Spt20 family-domain-containing protein [Kockovaella imperatae]ORX35571.1 Spt20 family-domain-containing protein [Kockovaella imperatae]
MQRRTIMGVLELPVGIHFSRLFLSLSTRILSYLDHTGTKSSASPPPSLPLIGGTMASASGYNHHRFARAVLKKSRKWEPSLVVQLYPQHWRFENSPMTFQYSGPMSPFLLALRAQVIPAALIPFLYDIRPPVSFVDGCLVVEIQDSRKAPEVRSRVVMRPAPEALAQTIDVMLERKGEDWDEHMALELESRIMAATSPPLYLGTSILSSRNAALAMSLTMPAGPNLAADGTYRDPTLSASGDDKSEVERMRKLLRAGERTGPFQPNWNILRVKETLENQERQKVQAQQVAPQHPQTAPTAPAVMAAGGSGEEKPKKPKKKRPDELVAPDDKKPSKKKKVDGEVKKKEIPSDKPKPKKKTVKKKPEEQV